VDELVIWLKRLPSVVPVELPIQRKVRSLCEIYFDKLDESSPHLVLFWVPKSNKPQSGLRPRSSRGSMALVPRLKLLRY